MFTLNMEEGGGSKSPQRRGKTEKDGSQDPGDPVPERSSGVWDRAELVAEETGQFEEPQTGVKVSYTLEEREIYRLLKKAYYGRKSKKRYILEYSIFIILFVLTILSAARYAQSPFLRISFTLCGVLLAALIVLFAAKPALCSRAEAKKAGGRKISMEVYPDHIEADGGGRQWEIQLDGSCYRLETDSMLAVFTGGAGAPVFPIPLSRLDPSVLPEVQAMITAGTRRRK